MSRNNEMLPGRTGKMLSFEALLEKHLVKWTLALDRVAKALGGDTGDAGSKDPIRKATTAEDKKQLRLALGISQESTKATLEGLAGLGQMIQATLPLDYISALITKMTELGRLSGELKTLTGFNSQRADNSGSPEEQGSESIFGLIGSETQGPMPAPEETPLALQAKATKDFIESETEDLNQNLVASDAERTKSQKSQWDDMKTAAEQGFNFLKTKHKSFAIGQIVIDTSRGIQRAFAEVPWPLNLVQAAQVGFSGAQQLSRIKGIFHNGISSVPETGTYLLQSGERVLDQRLNGDLKSFLSQAVAPSQTVLSPHVNLTVNGDVAPQNSAAWRDELEQAVRDMYRENLQGVPF